MKSTTKLFSTSFLLFLTLTTLFYAIQPVKASTTVTFNPVADSTVTTGNPDGNYGTFNYVWVQNSTLKAITVLRFDLSSIPDGVEILSATLSLYCIVVTNTTSIKLTTIDRMLNNSWDEYTITWNNYGGYTTDGEVVVNYGLITGVWYNWTITGLVSYAYANTSKQLNILLRFNNYSPEVDYSWFNSREASTNIPKLTVTYVEWHSAESWTGTLTTIQWMHVEVWKFVFPLSYTYYLRLGMTFVALIGLLLAPTLAVLGVKFKKKEVIIGVLILYFLVFILIHLVANMPNVE